MKNSTYKGFSLVEILVVVALIAILATITIVAINPAKNFADTRNTQRSADVSTILNAVTQYTAEADQGNTIADLGTIPTCPTATEIGTGTGLVNLTTTLVDEYVVAIPMDPSEGTAENTGYNICTTTSGRTVISSMHAENSKTITVQR